jgi:Asp/Glu/hydantoin racemase
MGSRYRLIEAFADPDERDDVPKEERLLDYHNNALGSVLAGVDWDYDPGPAPPVPGVPAVTNGEQLAVIGARRLPIVRRACESGKYNGIVLLGGAEPGAMEAREIAGDHGIPVTSCATAQFHVATMLGDKFSVIDVGGSHTMSYRRIIAERLMAQRCASIRTVPYPSPGFEAVHRLEKEKQTALDGGPSEAVRLAVDSAVQAVESDGAEVIVFGWLTAVLAAAVRPRRSARARMVGSRARRLQLCDRPAEVDGRPRGRRERDALPSRRVDKFPLAHPRLAEVRVVKG